MSLHPQCQPSGVAEIEAEFELHCGHHCLKLGRRTHLMGILNVTPNSFSDGGCYFTLPDALQQAHQMAEEGADIIDVGGESTRPGSQPVPLEEEIKRIIPVMERLVKEMNIPISVDTYKAEVAKRALDLGAGMINDVTALRGDQSLGRVVAQYKVPLILMHMQGTPRDMQANPHYESLISEIILFLGQAMERARQAGVEEKNILIDPGIGFGKKTPHNLEIIKRLREFQALGRPMVIGTSRKSVIGDVLNLPVEDRLEGTAATVACAVLNGAHILRVHDVKEMVRVARMVDAIKQGEKYA